MAAKLLRWVLGLGEPRGFWLWAMTVAFGVAGLVAGVTQARALEPMDPRQRRDAILGWGTIAVVLLGIAVVVVVTEGV